MKQFLTSLLGALVALFLFSIAVILLGVGIIGAIISSQMRRAVPASERITSGSYLVFDLSTNLTDAPPRYDWASLGDGPSRDGTLQLRTIIRGLNRAGTDSRIKGILLIGSLQPSALGSGYGALEELRGALAQFHQRSGKPIRAYLEFATTRDYYVASVADQVMLDPYGVIYMPGLATEPAFFAGAFQKYGVDIQVTRVGKYKSYVEPFIRENMSPENREETQRLLDDLWGSLTGGVARARHVSRSDVQGVVDREGLIRPDAAKSAHLVDAVMYRDQVIDELRKETGKQPGSETFRQVSLPAYLRQEVSDAPAELTGPGIAVVYAEGDIVDGEGGPDEIGGVRFARELRKLRQDDQVKAVVLRVNSPGGSATAAEDILRELTLTRKVKPVIVSMGSYAASGGYWISSDANRIFAEPTTITGSIGVFGIQFDIQKLANNLGITFDRVKTARFADSLTITRPKTPEELAILQSMVDWIYGQFITKVSEGRHLPRADVEQIAQGRVWSGIEAKRLHLVDEIGGLQRAIGYAADQAHLTGQSYQIMEYPRKRTLQEELAELFGRILPEASGSRTGAMADFARLLAGQWKTLSAFNDPRGVYARLPLTLAIH